MSRVQYPDAHTDANAQSHSNTGDDANAQCDPKPESHSEFNAYSQSDTSFCLDANAALGFDRLPDIDTLAGSLSEPDPDCNTTLGAHTHRNTASNADTEADIRAQSDGDDPDRD